MSITIETAGDLREGRCVNYGGKVYSITKHGFHRKGRGGSTIFLNMKSLKDGTQKEISCNSGEKFKLATLEKEEANFLCKDGNDIVCEDGQSYDYKLVDQESRGLLDFDLDGYSMPILLHKIDDEVVKITVGRIISAKIVETEPYLEGQTAVSKTKPATLANGKKINVPSFIPEGCYVNINTEKWEYDSKCDIKTDKK